jgi:mono/diheme cytochrome c family protein
VKNAKGLLSCVWVLLLPQSNQNNETNQTNQTNESNQMSTTMKMPQMFGIGFIALLLSAAPACSQSEPPPPQGAASPAPAELRDGEQKFTANCSACHGAGGVGTKQGPPLVHKVYEPNHHGDVAFLRAAANGVKSHHWQFGDMPKIDAVKPDDVEQIVKYVRWLQKQAGIF